MTTTPDVDLLIDARDVTIAFDGTTVLDGLSIGVRPGTILGFVGPSGSGKTTTVRLLTGLLSSDRGRLRVWGTDPTDLSTRQRQRIGYMPQLGVLHPDLTITENLRFLAAQYGVRDRGRAIAKALEELDLAEAADRRLRDCSGGMQRRVALIGALLHEPDLMFLDEPTTGLDPVLRQKVWTRLKDLRDAGTTIVVTTQIVSESIHCDEVALLSDGRIVAIGSPEELRRQVAGGDVLHIQTAAPLSAEVVTALAGLDPVVEAGRLPGDQSSLRVVVGDSEDDRAAVAAALKEHQVDVQLVERHLPDFDDVFVALLESARD